MELNTNNKRFEWIDALRAMAIVFVIYGHCNPGINAFYVFTSPIKMPLFFILSGFLFKNRDGDIKEFFKYIRIKLIMPWLLLSLIAFMPTCTKMLFMHNFIGIAKGISDILLGVNHWFMPCFIIGSIVHYIIRTFVKSELLRCILSFACFFIGIILKDYNILNVCMINRAINVQLFFYIGYCTKKYINKIKVFSNATIYIGLLAYITMCVLSMILYPGNCLDVHICYYYDIAICLFLIIIGNMIAFAITSKHDHMPKWITFIGRNSLVIYMLQGYGFTLITGMVTIMKIDITTVPQPIWAFVKMLIVIIACSAMSLVINRFVPIATGGRK